jgi:iron complex transport system substrate-binding protein
VRVVSLCPSLTETVADLGAGDALVGCTKFCVHPADLVERLPKVGGTKDPRVERILQLRPDLVLLNEEENRREDAQALTAAGIECHVSFPKRVEHVPELIEDLGRRLGFAGRGRELAEELRAEIEAPIPAGPAPRVVYLIWRKPWMSVNGTTFISDLLAAGGLENALGEDAERYLTLEVEALMALNPDRVLLSSEPFPFRAKHRDELVEATGWEAERFVFVDGERLSWHGTRCLAGLRYARELAETFRAAP